MGLHYNPPYHPLSREARGVPVEPPECLYGLLSPRQEGIVATTAWLLSCPHVSPNSPGALAAPFVRWPNVILATVRMFTIEDQ